MTVSGLREHKRGQMEHLASLGGDHRGPGVNRGCRGGAVQTQHFLSGLHCCDQSRAKVSESSMNVGRAGKYGNNHDNSAQIRYCNGFQ